MTKKKPEKIIVVGAGVSGATTARELAKKLNIDPANITILEAEKEVGGKLKTFHHPTYPQVVTEFGAGALAHNYPVFDVFKEKNIQVEKLLQTKYDTVEFFNEIQKQSLWGKFTYLCDFAWQNIKFAANVWAYNRACNHLDEKPPHDQELAFADFVTKHGWDKLATFLKFAWPGFGYGLYEDKNNYTYRVLNYMGYTTIPSICAHALVTVHGGYQQLVEKMLEGFNVQTAAHIQKIDRNEEGVKVDYEQDGAHFHLEGDMLVLACSPYFWKDLGMALTATEQACVDELSYYRYPTVICRIKGMKPEQLFFLDALEKNGLGHVAFLYTRDNRKHIDEKTDGRLCSVYINLPEGKNDFEIDDKQLQIVEEDLKKLPGVTEVTFEASHIWLDYNPSVPWATGIALQKQELNHHVNTLHVGTFLPGSFESVGGASDYAINAVHKWLGIHESTFQKGLTNLRRAYEFFKTPRLNPIDDETLKEFPSHGMVPALTRR